MAASLMLSGCWLWPPQLSPPTHLVTIEPDGSVVKDECGIPMQIIVPTMRLECVENGVQVVEECGPERCTYTRDGKVFRECRHGDVDVVAKTDCIENGVHISRKCDHGWTTVTCIEAIVK